MVHHFIHWPETHSVALYDGMFPVKPEQRTAVLADFLKALWRNDRSTVEDAIDELIGYEPGQAQP